MNYIEWNKHLWDYFFKPEFKNTKHNIVLAVNEKVINEIGIAYNINNPREDFINAINDGPSEIDSNNVQKFTPINKDFLTRAKAYIEKPNYVTRCVNRTVTLPRWNREECLFTAYLAFLILMITDENKYWSIVKFNLNQHTNSKSQNYTTELFEYFKKWANNKGYHYFYKNIYTLKKNVGTIYSQLPLTSEEEKQIIASLYDLKNVEPEKYRLFKEFEGNLSFDSVEQFIEEQKSFLNNSTAKLLNDHSSERKSVVIDYVFQNFGKYIQACEDACDEEMKVILKERKNASEKFKPELFYCINEYKIKVLILVNLKLNSSLKEGELTFMCGKKEFRFNARLGKNVGADDGENYIAYLIDIINMPPGTYKIYNGEIDTKYTFTLPPVPDFKSPIWYKDYSRSNPELKVIDIEKKILFDINNPYKIITQKDYKFTLEEAVNYGIKSLGNNFPITIGDLNEAFQIFTVSLAKIEGDFHLAGKDIQITNKELELTIQGAPDGKRGKTSFLTNVPITISYNATSASKVKIKDSEDKVIQEIKTNQNSLDTIFSTIIEPKSEGDYKIEITDKNNNTILKEFSISIGNISGQRIEKYLDYYVCDFKKLSIEKTIENKKTICTISVKHKLIEDLIDILIKGKKLTSIYDNDFKYILNCLLKKYDINKALLNAGIDALELSKKIIYLLDNLNIIEREGHYIKTIIKPYWIASSTDRRYNLVGALTLNDLNELERITSIKSRSQTAFRKINTKVIAFELPRQFYVEKCDEAKIPKTDKYPLHQSYQLYDFEIPEPSKEEFKLESQTLKVSNQDYSSFIPIYNLRVLNWFTLKYEDVNQKQFKEILTYWGYKLVEIESRKNYNNRVIKYYFLFSIDERVINYSYFPYEQKDKALILYLKKIQCFDFSTTYALTKKDSLTEFNNKYLKDKCEASIRKELNHLDAFKVGTSKTNFYEIIKNNFLYDSNKNIFGINGFILIPKILEKYLISLSGLLPVSKKVNVNIPNNVLTNIEQNSFISRDIEFKFYFGIPEEIAFTISNNLIEETVVKHIFGATAKPYVKIS